MSEGRESAQGERASNIALSYGANAKGISICPTVLSWTTSVADRLIDGWTDGMLSEISRSNDPR